MVSDGTHTHVSFRSTESVVNLSAARVLQKPAPSLSDLRVCVCVCARARLCAHFRSKASVVAVPVFAMCLYTQKMQGQQRSRGLSCRTYAHIHVCFTSTGSVVTVPVCGVCQWCLVTQTCVFANGGVARTGAHVISHTCVWPMQYYAENPWYLCTHMCVAKARNPWSRFGLPGTFSDCTY